MVGGTRALYRGEVLNPMPRPERKMRQLLVLLVTAALGAVLTALPAHVSAAGERAGGPPQVVVDHLRANHRALGLTAQDVSEWVVSNQRRSAHNGVTHVSLQQQLSGIDVFAGVLKVNVGADG